jgi:RNase P/RNase MRP subunit p29
MNPVLGNEVTVVAARDAGTVGVRGVLALETAHMLKILALRGRHVTSIPKMGTALRDEQTGRIIICDEMYSRLEERIARGSRL